MKTLHIPLEDSEFKQLEKIKGELTWREFMIKLIKEHSPKAKILGVVKK